MEENEKPVDRPATGNDELLKKKIEELDREKQQIISLVSHDIKAPLNRVFALVQLMQLDGQNLTADQHSYLDKMHLVVADGLGLIRNLVDYRNLEYRRIEIIPETINLSQLLQLVIRNFSPLAAKKKIQLEVDVPEELKVISDNHCVIRTLENLLSNAVKFSPEGKKIIIRAKESAEGIEIYFQDEAGGFSTEDLKKLYGKFQKLTAHPTAGESTTGLGLFIIKSMLEKVGGKIACETQPEIGSTFTVWLPKKFN